MQQRIFLNGHEVCYTLRRVRRARRLSVTIGCDAALVVTVPQLPLFTVRVEDFLRAKAPWILKTIRRFKRRGTRQRLGTGERGEFERCQDVARQLVMSTIERLNVQYNFKFNGVAIRQARTRWGSCSAGGNLNFNYKIVFLPERHAQYIVAHELCHLQEMNHSPRFWALVACAIPDYREMRRDLRKYSLT